MIASVANGGSLMNRPSPQELLRKLPPSGRDFEVFEHVVVDGGTTRSAAQEFTISQTRVCQVLDRVRAWLDELTPAATDEVSQKQLQLAEGLAADRLDSLYSQAMTGWRSSEGEVERIRLSAWGSEKAVTRTTSHGDTRYLAVAARIALLRSKVASLGVMTEAMAAAGDITEGPLPDCDDTVEPADHPDEACSENADCGARNAELAEKKPAPNHAAAKSSDPLTRDQAAARRAFFGPVQEQELGDTAAGVARGRSNGKKAATVMESAGVPVPG